METHRTTLRKPVRMDEADILDLQQNEQVRRYLGGSIKTEDFPKKFQEMIEARPPESYWVVREKETDAFIGLVSIARHHDGIHYEVSYELHPTFWGKGYATEIIESVIQWGFISLRLKEIYAETQKKNLASVRLLKKVGMKRIAELERFGETQVIYSIISTLRE